VGCKAFEASVALTDKAFEDETVMLPGPEPVSAIPHWLEGASTIPQLLIKLNPFTVMASPVTVPEPRFRSVRFGISSVERLRLGADVAVFIVASMAAVPLHWLLQLPGRGSESCMVLGSKPPLGACTNGRSKRCVERKEAETAACIAPGRVTFTPSTAGAVTELVRLA
jgi:hypothetical protein